MIVASRGTKIVPDCSMEDAQARDFDLVVFGGLRGGSGRLRGGSREAPGAGHRPAHRAGHRILQVATRPRTTASLLLPLGLQL
ncbi:MAG TPA: hypothetical protein EYP98_08895 [Planctomycetes bacterium]|nr:hypothetical protein [Planctomycetota bacterium]